MNEEPGRFPALVSVPTTRTGLLLVLGVLLILSDLLGPNPLIDPDYLSLDVEVVLGLTAILLAFAERVSSPQQRSKLRNAVIVSLVSMAVAGMSAEAATRWVFRNVTASADTGGYFHRQWSLANVPLNEQGFRENSFSIEKPAGVYRVAVVGDSFTFGNGLPAADRYTDLMNKWLPDRVEVLNFGFPGNNTPQHLEILRSHVLAAHPDFVLLQWFVNDIEGNDSSGRPHTWPLVPIPSLHSWLNAHSALYTIANMRWAEAQIIVGLAPTYPEYLNARAADANGPDARRDAALLHEMVELSHRNGSEMAIVLFPDPGQDLGAAYPFAFLHERVLAVCRQEAIPCVDLRTDFALVKDRHALWVSPFDHHPSARANEIAAVRILERLQTYWRK